MKKVFFFLTMALLLSVTQLQAQLGFHAGYSPQAQRVKNIDSGLATTTRFHGFYAGIHYTYGFAENFGATAAAQIRLNSATVKSTGSYIQDWQFAADVPLLVNYTYPIKHDFKIGAFAGPVVSVGIGYTEKHYLEKLNDPGNYEIVSSTELYDTGARKRVEMNVAAGVSLHYREFMLYGGYSFGFNDLDKSDSYTTRVRGFFVGIGMN